MKYVFQYGSGFAAPIMYKVTGHRGLLTSHSDAEIKEILAKQRISGNDYNVHHFDEMTSQMLNKIESINLAGYYNISFDKMLELVKTGIDHC